jgi:hypothetical protein
MRRLEAGGGGLVSSLTNTLPKLQLREYVYAGGAVFYKSKTNLVGVSPPASRTRTEVEKWLVRVLLLLLFVVPMGVLLLRRLRDRRRIKQENK